MRLDGDNGWLELERSEIGPPGSPGEDDFVLNVTVHVRGYSAADQSWIMGREWERFLGELTALERTRRGRVAVGGASPDDFRIEVFSTDSLGHMAVRGHVGWNSPEGHLLQLKFGFHFEPDSLPNLVRDLAALAPR
jgi:hypothetical protein